MKSTTKLLADVIAHNQAQMSIALQMHQESMEISVPVQLLVDARRELKLRGYPTFEEVVEAIQQGNGAE